MAACVRLLCAVGFMVACLSASAAGQAPTVEQLRRELQANPTSLKLKEALAEACLRECYLEESLKLWRQILAHSPNHRRARQVVERLTVQALDLDSHLDVLQRIIGRGITEGTAGLLDAASRRAASKPQKARVLYLRGLLALRQYAPARARAYFEAARRLYGETAWAARSAIALARAEVQPSRPAKAQPKEAPVRSRPCSRSSPPTSEPKFDPAAVARARRLLRSVIDNDKLTDKTPKELARLELLRLEAPGTPPRQQLAALRKLLKTLTTAEARRATLKEVSQVTTKAQGRWVPEAIDALAGMLRAEPPQDEAMQILGRLLTAARQSRDRSVLDRLLAALKTIGFRDAELARELSLLRAEALLSRAVVEDDPQAMERLVASASAVLKVPAGQDDGPRVRRLRGRSLLVRAQKLLALRGPTAALPALLEAKRYYLATLAGDPAGAFDRLGKIAALLEHMHEWETAAALHREVARRFPHSPQGRDALLRVAQLYERHLNAPLEALEAYAEYAARYPAELPYRQLHVGRRLRRLGYVNVLDFQKRNGLKPDGIFGPATRRKLQQLERSFDMIRADNHADGGILRGQFVHPAIFCIARRMERAGRYHQAIIAYRTFLNLFPTKKDADDALIAIARGFRANLLFEEALGAYRELMADYPNGDATSEAYVEAAGCLENLGRWTEAREYYELYIKKFPRYRHVAMCKERLAVLGQLQQYAEFIAANPRNPKVAEAQYQIGLILYKKLRNYTKAAVEFAEVARRYPRHVRAADGLFSAGVAQLRAENFPAARALFAELVQRYPGSRLADDGQFWIGHTYEYSARALGRLDKKRIVLKRRSLRARARLAADLALRQRYHPAARPGPAVPEEVWGGDTLGVLTSGSKRDRVNAELFRAIRAYRQVVRRFKSGDCAGKALLRSGKIYTDYLKDPEKGIAAYQELLAKYGGSEQALDAQFRVGEYLLEKRRYDQAVKAYEQFIYNYPRDEKVQQAMMAIARCHAATKDWGKALDAYQRYLNKFPQGRFAATARAQVEWIRTYHF